MNTSEQQANLGSTFIKAAFLAQVNAGLASNVYAALRTARYSGKLAQYSHSTNAALLLAMVGSGVDDLCADFLVSDEQSLMDMLEAVQDWISSIEPEGQWSAADHVWAQEAIDLVLSFASRRAKQALQEVVSGFAISGGDLGAWQQEMMCRDAGTSSASAGVLG